MSYWPWLNIQYISSPSTVCFTGSAQPSKRRFDEQPDFHTSFYIEILCLEDRNYIEKKRYIFPVVLHKKSLLGTLLIL